jgi:hypothetical protein
MAFKSGKEWKGNSKGAPKREFRRDDFTDEIFLERKDNIKEVVGIMFEIAMVEREKWAIELVAKYFLTTPKNRDDFESDVHANIVGKLADIPHERLVEIQGILLAQMNTQGEG